MSNNKWLAMLVSTVVLAAVVAAFIIIGSPSRQRQLRFDEQRVADLQAIQNQIVNYWQRKHLLPPELDDLTDSISGFAASVDPETGTAYEYLIQSEFAFALCATFHRPSQADSPMTPRTMPLSKDYPEHWDHAAGRVCFERVIDPDLYEPIKRLD